MKTLSLKTQLLQILLIGLFVSCITIYAAPGDIDASFNTAIYDHPSGRIEQILILPDGKVLAAGFFSAQRGKAMPSIARLNADGTLDQTFNPPAITPGPFGGSTIKAIAVQTDGKILVGGDFSAVAGVLMTGVVRLNPNGSVDTSFVQSNASANGFRNTASGGTVEDLEIAPDGRIIVSGGFEYQNGQQLSKQVVRLNIDGSLDASFNYVRDIRITNIEVQADGKLIVSSISQLFRLNTDGSTDNDFPIANAAGIQAIEVQTDGRIMIGGDFTSVNGSSVYYIARFLASGTFDTTFNPGTGTNNGPNAGVQSISVLPDGRYLIGGRFSSYQGTARNRTALIEPNGDHVLSFNYTNRYLVVKTTAVQADGKFWIGGDAVTPTIVSQTNIQEPLNRITPTGALDLAGETGYLGDPTNINFIDLTRKVLILPDGKILVSGAFSKVNGETVTSLVRLNADGTRDATFNINGTIGRFDRVNGFDVQPDGKILVAVAKSFTLNQNCVYRFTANGELELTISFDSSIPDDVKSLPGGRILVAVNSFMDIFTANGTIDGSFNPSFNNNVRRMIVQPDGKIIAIGRFSVVNGVRREGIARLNPNGTLDASFNLVGLTGMNTPLSALDLQADGKIVIGGTFTNLGGRSYLARLNQNGSLDTSFNAPVNNAVTAVKIQPDRKIVIGGIFTQVGSAQSTGLAKLNADGTLDTGFSTGFAVFGPVRTIDLQADGKLIIGGNFISYKQRAVSGITRIENTVNTAALRTPFDYDGDGRADISLFRPANGTWYQLLGANYNFASAQFGVSSDITTPADYDGDGKTDIAVFRNGNWYLFGSTSGFATVAHGQTGDIPLPADLDGDGRAELIVFRPSTNIWYSFNRVNNQASSAVFGNPNDRPVIGDYDGDGKSDIAVYRPTTGQWFYAASSQNGAAVLAATWGLAADKAVPADYDGDGKTDAAIFRDGIWAIKNSGNGAETILGFGTAGDLPVAADYDGDGRADIAVFRPTDGAWYQLRTAQGFQGIGFGANGDRPIPSAYIR